MNRLMMMFAVLTMVAVTLTASSEAQASEVCEASWYGPGLYGNPTASGMTFYGQAGYAAHKTLPLGTVVQATNLWTGQSAVLTINDRGPFIAGRCLDVSEGSAWIVGYSLAPVSVEVLSYPY